MEWLQTIRDLSILVAALVAAYGFDSWRREHTGKRRIELAEDALALFYEARDAISQIRSPGGFGDETKDMVRLDDESEELFRARKDASILFVRYNVHRELFSKIYAIRYRVMAQLGSSAAQPFDDLHVVISEMFVAARMLARLWARRPDAKDDIRKRNVDIEKYEAVFWEESRDDSINTRMTTIVAAMEKTCRSVVEGEGTLYALINRKLKRAG